MWNLGEKLWSRCTNIFNSAIRFAATVEMLQASTDELQEASPQAVDRLFVEDKPRVERLRGGLNGCEGK